MFPLELFPLPVFPTRIILKESDQYTHNTIVECNGFQFCFLKKSDICMEGLYRSSFVLFCFVFLGEEGMTNWIFSSPSLCITRRSIVH